MIPFALFIINFYLDCNCTCIIDNLYIDHNYICIINNYQSFTQIVIVFILFIANS